MKNPRSALCKTSIMAASDIFNAFGDKLFDPSTSDAFEDLVCHVHSIFSCVFYWCNDLRGLNELCCFG